MENKKDETYVELKVAGTTGARELAKAITSHMREGKKIILIAIGNQAVGQAVKAVPIVNGNLAPKGVLYAILPSFDDREVKDMDDPGISTVTRTVMVLKLINVGY